MGKTSFSLRRYDTQARVSATVSVVSIGSLLVLMALVFRNIDTSQWVIYYGNPTRRLLILAASALTLLLSAAGVGLGFNSAGQRRNDKPHLSWLGFFLGAGVLCLCIVMVYLFYKRAEFLG